MASLNFVALIGRLTRDPELRYTPSGVPVAHFAIAVDRTRGKEKETDFFDIVAWQKLAEICQKYLAKGRLVAVTGRIQIRNYETQDGQKRRAVEVIANEMQILDKPGAKPDEVEVEVAVGATTAGTAVREPALMDDVPF